MPERFRFRHVHAITGTFVLVVLGVLIAVLVFAGRSQRWFIRNVTVRIVLPEEGAAGIRQGSEVYLLGTLVGTVSDVSVNPAARMEADVKIRRDFFRFLRADSSAVVRRKFGLVGDAFFEITRGQGSPLPERNASIVCTPPVPSALETAVEEVRHEAVPALQQLRAGFETWTILGSNLITSRGRLDQLIGRLDKLTADLQRGKGTAGKLLTDPAIADELKTLVVEANRSVDELRVTLNHLQTASGNVELASTNLPALSAALGRGAKDLPGLVFQTQVSMRELERLLEAMQRTWLLRKHVNWTNPPPLRPLPPNRSPQAEPLKPLRSPKGSAG